MTVRKATTKLKTKFFAVITDYNNRTMTTDLRDTEELVRKDLTDGSCLGDDRYADNSQDLYLDDEYVDEASITIYEVVGKPKQIKAEVAGIKLVDVTGR